MFTSIAYAHRRAVAKDCYTIIIYYYNILYYYSILYYYNKELKQVYYTTIIYCTVIYMVAIFYPFSLFCEIGVSILSL